VFIGFMGAGKTTAAAQVAAALGAETRDSDALLEARLGHTIAEQFRANGEAAFRAAEEELVLELLNAAGPGSVVSLGGGSLASARVREALRRHLVVLLEVDPSEAWLRVGAVGGDRPLAQDRDAFLALHAARQPQYEEVADAFLPALAPAPSGAPESAAPEGAAVPDGAAPGVALRALPALQALSRAPAGTRLLWAWSASGEYPVFLSPGLIARERGPNGTSDADGSEGAQSASLDGEVERLWPLDRSRSRAYCVSDENVAPLYGRALGPLERLVEIPAGEQHKTLASAERVWQELARGGMRRSDHLVALGGGVVGDVAGFCAATYQRGVPVVQVPTTLVAQVDSAYGGKTGVDLPQAKNYVGAYHQPAGMLVDPRVLASLPERELAAGWVEVLKTALIAGGELWHALAADEPVSEQIIFACARTKLRVVGEDERDGGRRQLLNLGHTVGHAIEAATGYGRYRHGEAVGLGMLAALRLSGLTPLRVQVQELLEAHRLPVRAEGASVEEILAAVTLDKKLTGGGDDGLPPFVLVRAPGDVDQGCRVGEGELRRAIEELLA
jgi:shikimate kinase/3-dehydroquinate synthase